MNNPVSVHATLAEIAAQCGQRFTGPPAAADQAVFTQPWQAQAFATTVALHEQAVFTWSEWAQALGQAIARASTQASSDDGRDYYMHWLSALEQLVVAKGLAQTSQLQALAQAWDSAAQATPHGQPIVLPDEVSEHLSGG